MALRAMTRIPLPCGCTAIRDRVTIERTALATASTAAQVLLSADELAAAHQMGAGQKHITVTRRSVALCPAHIDISDHESLFRRAEGEAVPLKRKRTL